MRRSKAVFIGFILFLLLPLIGLVVYSYAQVEARVQGVEHIRPEFNSDLGAIIEAASSLLSDNYARAITAVLDGVNISAAVEIRNRGIVPVYLPRTKYIIFLDDRSDSAVDRATTNPGTWLMPKESRLVVVSALIPTEEIPALALDAIVKGGKLEINIESRLDLAVTTLVRREVFRIDVLKPTRESISQLDIPFID